MVRALASHQCAPGTIPGPGIIHVCGLSLLLALYTAPGFPLSSKTNISKFQIDLDYCQTFNHKPLARVIAQALPVFDVKFTLTFIFYIIFPEFLVEWKYPEFFLGSPM